MTTITIELTPSQERALKSRTGKRTAAAAAKAWIETGAITAEQIRHALKGSIAEEKAGKMKSFDTAAAAMKWLES
ncbi:MAG: hypothetical protein Q7J29_00230 [Stagnimonas sp.]|nr:hypothetical protein [Stagnimonas sp.]